GDEVATATHKHIKTLFSSRYWRRTVFNSVFCAISSLNCSRLISPCQPATLTVTESASGRFGHVTFEGSQIRDEYLQNLVPFKEGDEYESKDLAELNR
ncbi:hypothetical protein NE615_27500, partial [Escherichia coli]|uniref:POTRA domain-containing protein n=1 Tax=Escherichia coli TaxID=562 RepID=UPI002108ED32